MENPKEIVKQEREVAKLGDGEVFIKRTSSGAIKAVSAQLVLKEAKGELAFIQNKATITAAGYNTLNKIAGVSIISPEKLMLPEGKTVVNPYPIIDISGSISKVWVKKLGVGFTPTGNIAITSSTLLYDISMYFVQDIIKKIKKNKSAGRFCTESMLTDDEKKKGMFLPIQGTMGVWANLQDSDAQGCMETLVQNKLFAERKAQTICERNVLKKHPALSVSCVEAKGGEKNHYALINVIGYTHDLEQKDLMKLAACSSKQDGGFTYNGKSVEVIDANIIDDITEDDINVSKDDEEENLESSSASNYNNPINMPTENNQSAADESISESSSQNKEEILKELLQNKDVIGDQAFNGLIQKNFNKPVNELTAAQLNAAKIIVNNEISKAVNESF